ncbi:hypothetical protein RDI58_010541 [Solanum bulbocastanum]|uniref:DUF4216 domain-containing protein n=1 Tax=Solanum bulbocastanum TaxID=147425 RepID=A0AAN8TQQ1_SOLBU
MDVTGKTKDNVKAGLDLPEHCRRPELHLQESANNKLLKPKASYSFTMEQKRKICEWVESLKMLDRYASNLGKRVAIVRGILHGMKSHDCHVFMEQLLPIAFCGLPENIWKLMAEISLFFKDLCSSTLRVENLVRMAKNIIVISNKLEKILPPGFFDVIEHLPIHLVHEALLGGPVQYRSIGKSKRGIENKHRVEGCMIQVYLAKERLHFSSYYFDDHVLCLRNRPNRHDDIGNNPAVQLLSNFNQSEKYSKNKKTNNSGAWVKGDEGNQNENVDYVGVLHEILELEYSGCPIKRIVLFQCKWFDPTSRGTRELKQHNIIEVKHTRKYEAYDPFIIAYNAKQVYSAPYLLRRDKSDWWVVIKTKSIGRVEVENELDISYQNDISSVHQVVDAELEMNLDHPDHILEEVNREELDMPTNMEEDEEETFEEDEWIGEEENFEDDACEWIDDEESSEEDEKQFEYRSILPFESHRPFTQEKNENLWKQSASEPIRGSVYDYPEKAYQKKKSWYCGLSSSSFDGGDRDTISAMESKIAYLNAELATVAEREKKTEEKEKKREEEIAAAKEVETKRYAALQAQLTFIFESRNIALPCPANSDGSDQEGDENDKFDKESDQGDEE